MKDFNNGVLLLFCTQEKTTRPLTSGCLSGPTTTRAKPPYENSVLPVGRSHWVFENGAADFNAKRVRSNVNQAAAWGSFLRKLPLVFRKAGALLKFELPNVYLQPAIFVDDWGLGMRITGS